MAVLGEVKLPIKPLLTTLLILLSTLSVACNTSATTEASESSVTTEAPSPELTTPSNTPQLNMPETNISSLDDVPVLDRSQHSVPLEEIYFDTFRRTNRVVPLSEATDELILSLRDAIPPIYSPKFVPVSEARIWLDDDDIVVGYAADDEAYAYPIKIMNWHEMVNHEVNNRPILATY